MVNSFVELGDRRSRFDPAHVLTFQVGMSGIHRSEEAFFAEAVVERLLHDAWRPVGGLRAPAADGQLQDSFTLTVRRNGVDVMHDPAAAPDVRFISRDYLKTMGIPIVAGRGFTEQDGAGRPGVVVINEALARRDFAGVNPIGDFVVVGPAGHQLAFEIVGVAGNVRQRGLDRAPSSQYFMDIRQADRSGADATLFQSAPTRRSRHQRSRSRHRRRPCVARRLDPNAGRPDRDEDQILSNSVTRPRIRGARRDLFGVAVSLAAIGLRRHRVFGVSAHGIGIRMALGARRVEIMQLVLRQRHARHIDSSGLVAAR